MLLRRLGAVFPSSRRLFSSNSDHDLANTIAEFNKVLWISMVSVCTESEVHIIVYTSFVKDDEPLYNALPNRERKKKEIS